MGWISYNDFSDGKVWPESVVAMESMPYEDEEITYKIISQGE